MPDDIDQAKRSQPVRKSGPNADNVEQKKVGAVVRKRAARQQANELGKANLALRATLAQLASQPDHKAFLGSVLIEASRQLNADAGHLAVIDEAQGQVVTYAHSSGDQLLPLGDFPSVVPISQVAALPVMEAAGGPRIFDLKTEQHLFMPGTIEWHRQFGTRTVLTVPMILGTKTVGFLGFAFKRKTNLTSEKGDLMMALAQQAALATQLIQISQKEQVAAIAREREKAAQERAEELVKANEALQATVDATSQVLELDELVPKVLGIIGKVFETDKCAIFENLPSGEVRLWYWHTEGRTLLPAELLQLDEDKHSLVRRLAAGFTVPTEYLGQSSRMAGTVFLDHVKGTSVPEFDQWAVSIGCDLELNIGIASQGVRCATLCVYRPRGRPYSPREIVLAEALARQIGLALQVTKLSQTNLEAAVAREREQSARRRADELIKTNAALRMSLDRLASEPQLEDFLKEILRIAAEQAGVPLSHLWLHDSQDRSFLRLGYLEGKVFGSDTRPSTPLALFYEKPFSVPPELTGGQPLNERTEPLIVRIHEDANMWGLAGKELLRYYESLGIETKINIPLRFGGRCIGALAVYLKDGRRATDELVELVSALGYQVVLAMELTRLAQQVEKAAIVREREQAARQKADELAKANAILTLRDRLLNLVADASRELIQAPDLIAGIHSLLRRMGESTRLSRVLLFLQRESVNGGSEHYIVTEWCAPGIADHRSLGIEVIPNSIAKPFLERMKNLSGFWMEMQKVEEPMRSTLAPLKVVSTGCAPVMVGGEYAGVIAFDDCTALRSDDSAHVDAFLAVANFIGAALQRDSSQKALLAEQRERAALEAKAVNEREAAIFQERTRFAGQIHDTLAQGFTGTLLHLEALRVRVARGERVTVEELQNVRKIAALGLAEARRSALAIRPLALDGRDLSTALQQLTERSAVPGILNCRWSLGGIPRPLTPIIDEALLNIAHEALSNAIRHADASNILITLAFAPDGVSLLVSDDGIGFDASDSRIRGHTFGLRSMRDRAAAAGGELTVLSKHGEGTTVTVHLWNQ